MLRLPCGPATIVPCSSTDSDTRLYSAWEGGRKGRGKKVAWSEHWWRQQATVFGSRHARMGGTVAAEAPHLRLAGNRCHLHAEHVAWRGGRRHRAGERHCGRALHQVRQQQRVCATHHPPSPTSACTYPLPLHLSLWPAPSAPSVPAPACRSWSGTPPPARCGT